MQYLLSTKIVVMIYHCQGLPGYHTLETIHIGLVGIFVSQTIEIFQWTCVVKSYGDIVNSITYNFLCMVSYQSSSPDHSDENYPSLPVLS